MQLYKNMISKLSAVSVALAITSVLGQTCTISPSVQQILDDLSTLSSNSYTLTTELNSWDGSDFGSTFDVWPGIVSSVVGDLANDFQSTDSKTDCEAQAVVTALVDVKTNFIDAFNAITAVGNYFNNGGADVSSEEAGQLLVKNVALDVVSMVYYAYTWLPCDVVGQIFDTMDEMFVAMNQAWASFVIGIVDAPIQPPTCSPPTCKKQIVQKRSN
ncbi:hypothetical protein TRVA0_048S00540 [Trichomonascus vanleenenianus]|uniref:uncharacterized protein n=1 Tax=Trichomonascus vanleenenianus TaxID=2268995 RepID=UPI003ECB3834